MSDNRIFVHSGACFIGNRFTHCALEEAMCEGMSFESNYQVQEGGNYRATNTCLRRHPDHIGMCLSSSDRLMCTSNAGNCGSESSFIHNSQFCGIRYNHFPDRDFHLSLFGDCDGTCVWSSNDCPVGSTYTKPSHSQADSGNVDDLCTCDKVKTGACIRTLDNDKTCAVSVDACDATSTFKTWQELEAEGNPCFLCDTFSKDVSASPVQPDGFNGGSTRTGICASGTNPSAGSLIAFSLAVVLFVVATIEICFVRRKAGNNQDTTFKEPGTSLEDPNIVA